MLNILIVCISILLPQLTWATSSLQLSGINAYATATDATPLDFAGSFTIELQFQTNTVHTGCLISKFHQNSGSTLDDSYHINVQSDTSLLARIQTNNALVTLTATGGNIFDGQWHHVALVFDSVADTAELYLDGTLGSSAALTGTLRNTTESLRLGTLRNAAVLGTFFNGQIDEIRLWNTARRGEQAGCLKQTTILYNTPSLVSYYHFDEGTGGASNDEIPPFENFSLISGATFSASEPNLQSRISGAGQCLCGSVSGTYNGSAQSVTLVGDTVRINGSDSLKIISHVLTIDSSVNAVLVNGTLIAEGTISDTTVIQGQTGAGSVSQLLFNAATISKFEYAKLQNFSTSPLKVGASLNIDHCLLKSNGGVLDIASNPTTRVVVLNSLFENNSSIGEGGAIRAVGSFAGAAGDSLIIGSCTFRNNSALRGGALYARNMNLTLIDCLFDLNLSIGEGGAVFAEGSGGFVSRTFGDSLIFSSNSGGSGSALICRGVPNSSPAELYLSHSEFSFNSRNSNSGSAFYGAGLKQMALQNSLLYRCRFFGNQNSGGAVSAIQADSSFNNSPIELRNLTISQNTGDTAAVILRVPALIRNSIVSENSGVGEISGTSLTVSYCLTSDTQYHGPGGSFYADPLYEDFETHDYRLTAGSPCINRGHPNLIYNDADGSRADIGAFVSQNFGIAVQSIDDIPHDNGRQVMCQWLPSAGDDNRQGIESYQIYRRVNLTILENYELVAEIPAGQLEGYGQIVTTLSDSNQTGNHYYAYFVRSQSINPLAYWDSPLDSGYSVDNIAPSATALMAILTNNDILLSWSAVNDSDFACYNLYRAAIPFDADTMLDIYQVLTDTSFTDLNLAADHYYYVVRTQDINGNLSEPSNLADIDIMTIEAPQGLTIFASGGTITLRWQAVAGADRYNIYQSTNPETGFGDLLGTTTETVFITSQPEIKMFYVVEAEGD